MIKGLDVSRNQGFIDWGKVKKDGYEFAIIKATKRDNSLDNSFIGNYLGASINGLKVGVYKYVYATTVQEACEEAQGIIKALNGGSAPCGIWIDVEHESLLNIPRKTLCDIIFIEQFILRLNGYHTGVYCSDYWYKHILPIDDMDYCFWIARYGKDDGLIHEEVSPLGIPKVSGWQYTSKGKVNGINGNVDLDVVPVDLEDIMKVFG